MKWCCAPTEPLLTPPKGERTLAPGASPLGGEGGFFSPNHHDAAVPLFHRENRENSVSLTIKNFL